MCCYRNILRPIVYSACRKIDNEDCTCIGNNDVKILCIAFSMNYKAFFMKAAMGLTSCVHQIYSRRMHDTQKSSRSADKENLRVVIACRVMKPELDAWVEDQPHIEVRYLDQNMHERPAQMPAVVQAEIDAVEVYAGQVILGYGL